RLPRALRRRHAALQSRPLVERAPRGPRYRGEPPPAGRLAGDPRPERDPGPPAHARHGGRADPGSRRLVPRLVYPRGRAAAADLRPAGGPFEPERPRALRLGRRALLGAPSRAPQPVLPLAGVHWGHER